MIDAIRTAALALLALGAALFEDAPHPTAAPGPVDEPVRFARDVLPLLSDRCFACHGPDAAAREADLRLDRREDAVAERGWYRVVAPGDPAASELIVRVRGDDGADPMPPVGHGEPLSAEEVRLLERWIEQGAPYEPHWAYAAPVATPVPEPAVAGWARNAVDAFTSVAMVERGLVPRPEADPATLVRRLCLTLWGLPPTPELVERVLADEGADWYERLVDELLAHPRHAEHQARQWLDAARYGDTHGLHLDNERSIWPYRDWVIEAFASNLPYDRFVVEQLAGDLLPEPTRAQLVATGFNRCNPTTAEGGLIDAEYLAKYAFDRVETTATVFLGLTLGCARCHDHKYDPFSIDDYYALYSFFDDAEGEASDGNALHHEPTIAVPSPELEAELARRRAEVDALAAELDAPNRAWDREQAEWEAASRERLAALWQPLALGGATAEPEALEVDGERAPVELVPRADGALEARGPHAEFGAYLLPFVWGVDDPRTGSLRALRLEVLPGGESGAVGRAEHGNLAIGAARLERREGDTWRPVRLVRADADHEQEGYGAAGLLDDDPHSAWALEGAVHEPHAVRLELAEPAPAGAFRLVLEMQSAHPRHFPSAVRLSGTARTDLRPLELGPWERSPVLHDPDGGHPFERDLGPDPGGLDSAVAFEPLALVDGQRVDFAGERAAVYLRRRLVAHEALRLRVALSSDDGLRVWLDGALVHSNDVARSLAPRQDEVVLELGPGEHELLCKVVNRAGDFAFAFEVLEVNGALPPERVAALLAREPRALDEAGRAELRRHFRATASPDWAERRREQVRLEEELARLEGTVPRTPIMRDRERPVPTHVLERGLYDRPGRRVESDVPAVLGGLPDGAPRDRLGLARWIASGDNPLTARVAVNRVWQQHFGRGLVATPEDFGVQGAWPTHPELLDHLALELVARGWDLRWLHREVLGSATWRQSSAAPPASWDADPDNRWLARGPRFRLDGEVLRDQALFASGLLVERVGGPSVRPYQPPGLWRAVAYPSSNTARFERGQGEDLHRRSLYTFWKRTSPPPALTLFDAPSREFCVVRRERTNTPLQALALLNDEQMVEAARTLAVRAHGDARGGTADAVDQVVRHVLGRAADARETRTLERLFDDARASFGDDAGAARALLAVGATPAPTVDDRTALDIAALTLVAQAVLCLDATVTLE